MGIPNLPFSRVHIHAIDRLTRCVPSRRSVLSACTALAMLAGPAGLATANAVSTANPAATSVAAKEAAQKPGAAKAPAAKAAAPKAPNSGAAKPAAPQPAVAVAAAKPAAPPPDPYAASTLGQLEPSGLYGEQEHFTPSSEQWSNAKTIVQVTRQRRMSPYAAVIAVSVAMQESSLRNLTAAIDADSLGLFQQRPSMGWGSARELTDPAYATAAFLSALTQYAPSFGSLPLWQAAQQTQRSGYPTAYARWQDQAAHMVEQIAAG
jgi:hypothetical protein